MVTAEGALELVSPELELELESSVADSSELEPESSVLESSKPDVLGSLSVEDDDEAEVSLDEADAVVCVALDLEVVVPMEPS